MGNISDVHTVVDPRLRVKGVAGLRVADASIMPTVRMHAIQQHYKWDDDVHLRIYFIYLFTKNIAS